MSDDLTGGALQVAQQLPSDLAIMRVENGNICSMAAARPRSMKSIKAAGVEQMEAFPDFAADALAEDRVTVEATFTDYQKGRIRQDAGIVSKFYRSRRGKIERIPDDRFYNVVVKAESARRVREVITRSVPPELRQELFKIADRMASKVLTPKVADQIVQKFSTLSVTLEQIETVLGRSKAAGWTEDDRKRLLGLWQAIQDGETTVSEIFETLPAPKVETTTEPAKSVTMDDLLSGDAEPAADPETTPTPEPATEPEAPAEQPGDDYAAGMKMIRDATTADDLASISNAIDACATKGTITAQQASTIRRTLTRKPNTLIDAATSDQAEATDGHTNEPEEDH